MFPIYTEMTLGKTRGSRANAMVERAFKEVQAEWEPTQRWLVGRQRHPGHVPGESKLLMLIFFQSSEHEELEQVCDLGERKLEKAGMRKCKRYTLPKSTQLWGQGASL